MQRTTSTTATEATTGATRRHARRRWAAASVAAVVVAGVAVSSGGVGTAAGPTTLIPIGSDYQAPTLELFARAAAEHSANASVRLLVLPITYGTDPLVTSKSERKKNLTLADTRRGQIEAACNVVKLPGQTCTATLVPALVRSDASLQSNLDLFTADIDGMFVLGGDQTVAMGVVAGTPLEARMDALYRTGVVFGGNSAGDAVQSLTMINGYVGDNGAPEGMRQGAIDVYTYDGPGDLTRGLSFGMPVTIAEQHVFERGRLGRALNVSATYDRPVLGMDQATGGVVTDNDRLTSVTGATAGLVVDPDTFGSTHVFGGPNQTLAVRDIVTHILPPGPYGYDFATDRPMLNGVAVAPPTPTAYPTFSVAAGAGPLLLSGGIAATPANGVGQRFVTASGGAASTIVVLATGYARAADARAAAKSIATALQPGVTAPIQAIVVDARTDVAATVAAIDAASGIVLTAPDAGTVLGALAGQPAITAAVRSNWETGATLLADNAAAAALGTTMSVDAPYTDIEADASADFLTSGVQVAAGLGWVGNLSVTPRLVVDYRWGQAYRVLATSPSSLSVGIDVGTAVEIAGGTAVVRGDNAAVVLDGRGATFGTGTNGALANLWTVVDTFVDGQTLA